MTRGIAALVVLVAVQSGDRPTQLPSAPPAVGETRVFIVRHAEKDTTVTSCPGGGTICQPLTSIGQARAEELARLMKNQPLKKIYSTEYKRTQDTAKPSDRAPSIWASIPAREQLNTVAAEIAKEPGTYLIVTHSDVALAFLRKFIGEEIQITTGAMPSMANVIDDPDYDNLFVLTLGPGNAKSCKLFYFGAKTGVDLAVTGCTTEGRVK